MFPGFFCTDIIGTSTVVTSTIIECYASTTGAILTDVIVNYWPYILGAIALFGVIRIFKHLIFGSSK